jgi:hypothetical protein
MRLKFGSEQIVNCCINVMEQVVGWQGERFPWASVRGVLELRLETNKYIY